MSRARDIFAAALLDPGQPVPAGLGDGSGGAAGRRFNVHRNNVAVSLREALHAGFPVVARLLGRRNMDILTGRFLRTNPPSSPLMMRYGAGFPEFLAARKSLAHLGYLPGVARLELALRRAYHARDATPVAPGRLAAIPPEALMSASLALAPATQVLRSDWPVHDIWRFNTRDGAPKPRATAQDVLITRAEFDPAPHLLPPGGAAWITAIAAGHTIGAALTAALRESREFDLAPVLTLLLQGNAIISLITERPEP